MCGGYSDGLCPNCIADLPRTEQAQTKHNGTEITLAAGSKDIVAALKAMHIRRAAAFLFYDKDHPIRKVIHQMKYKDQPQIGYQLGKQAAIEMQYTDFFDGIDVIIPIPLHPRRLRERGYNQSAYIAQGISEITGIPVDTTHVTRNKHTPKQALQSGEDRRNNVADAFAVNHPEQMYHKHILVVDDLITTGETMKACLKTMKAFRGATFTIMALCKAR